jgi:hypothetical protein
MLTGSVIMIMPCQFQAPLSLFQPYWYLSIGITVNINVVIDIITAMGFVIDRPLFIIIIIIIIIGCETWHIPPFIQNHSKCASRTEVH